jgi:RNA polymerase sigma factor (sigma-70 family)
MTANSEYGALPFGLSDPVPGSTSTLPPASHTAQVAQLFTQEYTKLVKGVSKRIGSWEEAKDIVADAFIALLALKRPGSVSFPAPYLHRTARNLAANHLKRLTIQRRMEHLLRNGMPSYASSPESVFAAQERIAILQRALEKLPPVILMAVTHRIWDELPYEAIVARFAAKEIDVTERTVRRYVEQAFCFCLQEILAAENPRRESNP